MSVNFNSILGGGNGEVGGLPLTMTITHAAAWRNSDTGTGATVGNTNSTFTIDKSDSGFTINPNSASGNAGAVNQVVNTITSNILAIALTPTLSKSLDDGIYFIDNGEGLVNVNFGEYRKFLEDLEVKTEKNNQSETIKE